MIISIKKTFYIRLYAIYARMNYYNDEKIAHFYINSDKK